jgi:hypothetical protein
LTNTNENATVVRVEKICNLNEAQVLFCLETFGLVRLAGGWWLVLICCERKILLAGWWLLAGTELV